MDRTNHYEAAFEAYLKAKGLCYMVLDETRQPRFDVYVPRAVGAINKLMDILPRAGREAVGRALEADKVMARADMAGRAAYEQRVAASEPKPLEPAEEAPNTPREPVG